MLVECPCNIAAAPFWYDEKGHTSLILGLKQITNHCNFSRDFPAAALPQYLNNLLALVPVRIAF